MVLFTVTFTFPVCTNSFWWVFVLSLVLPLPSGYSHSEFSRSPLGLQTPATGPRSERLRGEVFLPSVFSRYHGRSVCITVHFRADDHRGNHLNPTPHARKQKESWEHPSDTRKKKKRKREWSRGTTEVMRAASWTDDQPAAQCSMKIVLSFHGQGGHILWDFLHTGHQPTVIVSLSSLTRGHIKG